MEKYNAETMAIVPRKLTWDLQHIFDKAYLDAHVDYTAHCISTNPNYDQTKTPVMRACEVLISKAPQVEPVMPLSEVLELLENELKDMDVEDDFTDGFKSGFSLAHHLIKQKYGVSE